MTEWDKLEFLLGSWRSLLSGEPGQGLSGSATFVRDLDGKVMLRRSRAEFAPAAGETKGLVHDDLLIIYQQIGEDGLRAVYFDNEGHNINYVLRFPAEGKVVFESPTDQPSPRFRLEYELGADGSLTTEFFVAAPGGALLSHVKGTVKRVA